MDKQAWSRQAIVVAAAVALAAAVPLTMKAHAHPFGRRIGGSQVMMGADGGSTVDEAAPTDDGSIIIECVDFDGRMMPHANEADTTSTLHAVSMPQHSLGPSKCWSREHKRSATGGGAIGGLMTVF